MNVETVVLLSHLVAAERHVAEAVVLVRNQQALVDRLERDGHDTGIARKLLEEFAHTLEIHRSDRDRLRAQLGATPSANG